MFAHVGTCLNKQESAHGTAKCSCQPKYTRRNWLVLDTLRLQFLVAYNHLGHLKCDYSNPRCTWKKIIQSRFSKTKYSQVFCKRSNKIQDSTLQPLQPMRSNLPDLSGNSASIHECHWPVSKKSWESHWSGVCFQWSADQLVVLIDLRLRSMMKGHIVTNLLTSSFLSLQGNLKPWFWCIDRARPRSEISL